MKFFYLHCNFQPHNQPCPK